LAVKDKKRTAAELLKELESDLAYRKRRAQQDQLHDERGQKIQIAEAPLVADLHAVGVRVSSVWDLVNTRATYAPAIPVLLEHLQREYIPEVREGIARALGVPEASWAWDVLMKLFKMEPAGGPRNVRWALACALSGAATDDVIDQVIALTRDTSLGEDRLILLSALARSKVPAARQALEDLRQDPQLTKEIRILCGSPKKGKSG
jgi:hypothetical protein